MERGKEIVSWKSENSKSAALMDEKNESRNAPLVAPCRMPKHATQTADCSFVSFKLLITLLLVLALVRIVLVLVVILLVLLLLVFVIILVVLLLSCLITSSKTCPHFRQSQNLYNSLSVYLQPISW